VQNRPGDRGAPLEGELGVLERHRLVLTEQVLMILDGANALAPVLDSERVESTLGSVLGSSVCWSA